MDDHFCKNKQNSKFLLYGTYINSQTFYALWNKVDMQIDQSTRPL